MVMNERMNILGKSQCMENFTRLYTVFVLNGNEMLNMLFLHTLMARTSYLHSGLKLFSKSR